MVCLSADRMAGLLVVRTGNLKAVLWADQMALMLDAQSANWKEGSTADRRACWRVGQSVDQWAVRWARPSAIQSAVRLVDLKGTQTVRLWADRTAVLWVDRMVCHWARLSADHWDVMKADLKADPLEERTAASDSLSAVRLAVQRARYWGWMSAGPWGHS